MKFTKLFERSRESDRRTVPVERKGSTERKNPADRAVSVNGKKYSRDVVCSIRKLIEDSLVYTGDFDDTVPNDGEVIDTTGKELLFDDNPKEETVPEVSEKIPDEPADAEVGEPEETVPEVSDNSESVKEADESSEESKKPEEETVPETVPEAKPDYFLDDDVYNQCKKGQSDKLGVEFVPDTYESDTEIAEKEAPADYYLSDEADAATVTEEAEEPEITEDSTEETVIAEESTESKELKDDVEDVAVSEQNPEAVKIYDKLIDMIQQMNYDETVDFVDDIVKDPKLKFLLSLGFGGDFSNMKLKLKKATIPVRRLVPTQSEIGTEETLKYLVQGKDIDVCFEKSTIIKKPIVTFQGTFIIDGHHRWSQIFVTNPNANVVSIDITGNLSPLSMLKAVQCTIGSNTGKLIRKDIKGENLYDVSEKEIREYLSEKLTGEVLECLYKYYKDPVDSLTQNVIQMQRNNTPILNAPDRGEMPQTSKDPELFDDLKSGVTEV